MKSFTPEILTMPQARNYDEIPVQIVCLYFFFNIHNFFHIFYFLLLTPNMGWLATQSTPVPLPPSPSCNFNILWWKKACCLCLNTFRKQLNVPLKNRITSKIRTVSNLSLELQNCGHSFMASIPEQCCK